MVVSLVLPLFIFYFNFRDEANTTMDKFLRSLIGQLSSNFKSLNGALHSLYKPYEVQNHPPSSQELRTALRTLLGNFKQIYMIIDAIDESKEIKEFIGLLKEIISWKISGLHLLVTGQQASDAANRFESIAKNKVYLETERVDTDIRRYICDYIYTDEKLKSLPQDLLTEIENSLMKNSKGM
jgi:hypothetical protein